LGNFKIELSAQMTEDMKCSLGRQLQSQQSRPGVCGLDNSGNSCYLNAVLQCLCSTMPLVEHLLNQDTRKDLGRLAQVFVQLLEKMWLGSSSSCAPVETRSMLGSIFPQFDNYTQQDAQELLLHLLNGLHEDLKKVPQNHSSTKTPGEKQSTTESTIISDLFEGQLSYLTYFMQCGHQAHNAQIFTVLSLPIPKKSKKCSIEDCLSLFFEETILTAAEQTLCSACGLRREAAVQTCLDKPPEILILHLKRFGCKGKSQVKLSTVSELNIQLSHKEKNPIFLSLQNHTGHLDMGHYTAVCYNSLLGMWHCFDDALVREVQEKLVQSPNAYVLFYMHKPFYKPKIQGL
uniref:ubiquitinyl hydrolase 1 n=1 Tax=Cyprinodon variegatus TaxID=28743 RepID=A0A3Q2CUY4_CYPVA